VSYAFFAGLARKQTRKDRMTAPKPKTRKPAAGSGRTPPHARFLSRWYLLVPIGLAVAAGIVFAWYYQPLQIWYRETRHERVLKAELQGIDDYNEELRHEISSLETTEGIEDYARRELNLVEKGDHSVVVTRDGQPLVAEKNTRESMVTDIPKNAKPFGAWTDFLDSIFAIEN
jgi:hypothetical protein